MHTLASFLSTVSSFWLLTVNSGKLYTFTTHLSSLFCPQFCNSFLPLFLLPSRLAILLGFLQGIELRNCIIKGHALLIPLWLYNCGSVIHFFCSKYCMYTLMNTFSRYSWQIFILQCFNYTLLTFRDLSLYLYCIVAHGNMTLKEYYRHIHASSLPHLIPTRSSHCLVFDC